MFLSGPTAIPYGLPPVSGSPNSVIEPAGVMRPTLRLPESVNQMLPSAPAVMREALARPQSEHDEPGACGSGSAYSITPPEVRDAGRGDAPSEDVGEEGAAGT